MMPSLPHLARPALLVLALGLAACGLTERDQPDRFGTGQPIGEPGFVTIAGARVPRDRAIVLLHFGHSNMMGFGRKPADLHPHFFATAPNLWTYAGGGQFLPAREPTATRRSYWTAAGPGMALLRAAATRAPADVHFVSIGVGISAATSEDFSKGGLYYGELVDRARELVGRATFAGAFVMLGVTDRLLPEARQGGFPQRMRQIAADLRADLDTPELPILHTDYEMEATGNYAVTGPIGQRFRPLILALPGTVPGLALIPTDGLGMQDDHHFDLAGLKLWSDRAVDLLVARSRPPWATR